MQTKNKLNNETTRSDVYASTTRDLSEFFERNPVELSEIAKKCLVGRKARDAASRARDIILSKSEDRLVGPTKLKDCVSTKASECELFLVEG
ncbi:MAG: DNA topoisomerase IV subunit B, partial [Sarcina sp.]